MKQKILMLLSLLVISVTAMGQTAVKPAGSGTQADPFQISSAENLLWCYEYNVKEFTKHTAGMFLFMVLTNDIDMSSVCHPADEAKGIEEVSWNPIGSPGQRASSNYYSGYRYSAFYDVFDGQGYSIYNLYQNNVKEAGLFGHTKGGTIKNVHLKNVNIKNNSQASYATGALVGTCENGSKIEGCSVSGIVYSSGSHSVGGLIGQLNGSYISKCVNYAKVVSDYAPKDGNYYYYDSDGEGVGGLVGQSKNRATFFLCENHGDVVGVRNVGGIIGNGNSTNVTSCINSGFISASVYVGGIGGKVYNEYYGIGRRCNSCLNTGMVSGKDYVAGISTIGINIGCLNGGDIVVATDKTHYGLIGCEESNLCQNSFYSSDASITWNGQIVASCATSMEPSFDASASKARLESGEITYLMQQNRDTVFWKQNLGVDKLPQLNMDYDNHEYMVVANDIIDCRGERVSAGGFKNGDSYAVVQLPHTYNDDFCTTCHDFVEPEFVGEVYRIKSSGNLWWFKDAINRNALELKTQNAELAANIDLAFLCENFEPWTAIGNGTNMYKGTFDGKGYAVRNLTYNNSKDTNHNGGLFGFLNNATIKDLKVIGNSTCLAGGLLAYSANKSTLVKCYVKGSLTCSAEGAGGMIGFANLTKYDYCVSYVDVTGISSVGGLIGKVNASTEGNTLFYCASYGTLKGSSNVGGLIGAFNKDAITNSVCYSPHASGFEGYYYKGDGTKVSQTKQQMNSGETLEAMADNNWFQEPEDVAPVLGDVEGFKHYQVNCLSHEIIDPLLAYFTRDDSEVRIYNDDGHSCGKDGFCLYCKIPMEAEVDEDGNFLIANLGSLIWFRDYVNKNYPQGYKALQTADIDLSSYCHPASESQPEVNWKPILNSGVYGTYDGGGHTITGLYINDPEVKNAPNASFFGYVGYNGAFYSEGRISHIKNLTIEGDITSGADCGIFAGGGHLAIFENCTSRGAIHYEAISGQSNVAGIMGRAKASSYTNCHNEASITGVSKEQQLNYYAGIAVLGIFDGCTNTGDITIYGGYAGGISCSSTSANPDATEAEFCIRNCSNTGRLVAVSDLVHNVGSAGAITGRITTTTPIINCWYSSDVILDRTALPAQGKITYGGIYAGLSNVLTPDVRNCYYNSDKQVAESFVAIPKTAAQFASGEVAYLLGEPWGQNITNAPKDAFPVLDGPKVDFDGSAYFNALDNSINALVKLIDKMNAGNATKADVENMVNKLLEK